MEKFILYTEQQLDKVEPTLNRNELRNIFLHIYGNPVMTKESAESESRG